MIKYILFTFFALSSSMQAQAFGQNKVQYRDFEWNYIANPDYNFAVYYYGDQIELATYTLEESIKSYEQISKHLRWQLKKPVSIIIYNSHNEFQQNNVVSVYMQEGILGVTELYKNRVVMPFEGDYQEFRNTLHHELVHAMINDMVYGGRIQNIVRSRTQLSIPLWANEGLAEFLSSNWDTEVDMIIRDLAINERIPSISELQSILAYRGGQSVWRFIAKKYGREKIAEILQAMKRYQNAEKGFEEALGMDYEELNEQWQKYIKKEYFPDIAGRDAIDDVAKPLTDHKKSNNFYNIAPAISPDGSQIVYFKDNMGYIDIDIIDAVSGKKVKRAVKGNRSIEFEELKLLQPGVSWSPDGRKIVIAAKAGSKDAFHIINTRNGDSKKIPFDLEGVFTPKWSPDGMRLAFVGNKNSASDIYTIDLNTNEIVNLTSDIFSDSEPSWHPSSSKLLFVSDRGTKIDRVPTTAVDMIDHNFEQNNIYSIDINTKVVEKITNSSSNKNYPVYANTENVIFYTSDYNGTWNIFKHDLDSGNAYPVTNFITGLKGLSLTNDDAMMIFSGYSGWGWDVYSLNNPLQMKEQTIEPTIYIKNIKSDLKEDIVDLREDKYRGVESNTTDYSDYIFAWEYQYLNDQKSQDDYEQPSFLKSNVQLKNDNGEYIPQSYLTRFSLDIADYDVGYNTLFGPQGYLTFQFSDLMGDHNIQLFMESQLSYNNDFGFSYQYLKERTDYQLAFIHQAQNFFAGYGFSSQGYPIDYMINSRDYGLAFVASRPFNRFNRLDAGIEFRNLERKLTVVDPYINQVNVLDNDGLTALRPAIGYVFDNSVNGFLGPIDGFRQNATIEISPAVGEAGISFQSFKLDMRKYQMINRDNSLAGRLYFGYSTGRNPSRFFLGGMQNWMAGSGTTDGIEDGSRSRYGFLDSNNESLLQDLYLSELVWPMRGARYGERYGTNVLLMNFEYRFPLIKYLVTGPLVLGNILGHIFVDVGAAWDDPKEFTDISALRNKYGDVSSSFSPWVRSIGYGIKLPIILPWRIEAAYDWTESGFSKPQWYISIGFDW